jgi:hypothetical protein
MQTVELCVLIFVFGFRLFSVTFYAAFLHISDLILKLLGFIAFYYRVISLTMGKMVTSLTRIIQSLYYSSASRYLIQR